MWGNPKLVTWDYNKDVNLTLEDALISMESLRFMLGGKLKEATEQTKVKIRLTEEVVIETADELPPVKNHLDDKLYNQQPENYKYINLDTGERGEVIKGNDSLEPPIVAKPLTAAEGTHLRIFWEQEVNGTEGNGTAAEIVISPNTFPGVYRVYGDTFMRNGDGKDQAMQFIIGKAKVLSNTTITMQAEGDPSTFEMTLNVMKSTNDDTGESEMFRLVSYEL